MEDIILDILSELRSAPTQPALTPARIDKLIRKHSAGRPATAPPLAKRKLLPYYLDVKEHERTRWESWQIDPDLEERLLLSIRMKPRRTASGVTTITVLTLPYPCSGRCIFCPNDLRMPKSYLASEPACQRAEQLYFDPFLQVSRRLQALDQMGHATDKVELIVLGGTFSDYPRTYQLWFIRELFRALNTWPHATREIAEREEHYQRYGISNDPTKLTQFVAAEQQKINAGACTYNEAWQQLYHNNPAWQQAISIMQASLADLTFEQQRNISAAHRSVGLVVETRPDAITPTLLAHIRSLGCTKIQIGIQSTKQDLLDRNDRGTTITEITQALALIRLFGFKIHVHLMANLLGATPASDKEDYRTLMSNPAFLPDEVKLYPCALVAATVLERCWQEGTWRPYTSRELLDVLVADTLATPPFVRISRMVRDISAEDILAGNKQANLRQLVDEHIADAHMSSQVHDIRSREIAGSALDPASLTLDDCCYETSVSTEHFLQWVTPEGCIAGFCRLSLPHWDELQVQGDIPLSELPTEPGDAMIREVHIYGREAHLGQDDSSSQHKGLGRKLVETACTCAQAAGYKRLFVISAIGTRTYYEKLGFTSAGLYQARQLGGSKHDK